MSSLAEVQQAILALPAADYARLVEWLSERDWEHWDREFEADVKAGRLDVLAGQAREARERGTLRDL